MSTGYKAYSKQGHVTADTPSAARDKFFTTFPKARKCDIVSGQYDGQFFTVAYGRASLGQWPTFFDNVTKHTIFEVIA